MQRRLRLQTLWLGAFAALACGAGAAAQAPPEMQALIDAGDVPALEARFGNTPTNDELGWLAQAQTRRAAATQSPTQRRAAFQDAIDRFDRWIAQIEGTPVAEKEQRIAALAQARLTYARTLHAQAAAGELDRLAITDGRAGDREWLRMVLGQARDSLIAARHLADPVLADLERGVRGLEDKLLILGLEDTFRRLGQELPFETAWIALALGQIEPDPPTRAASLNVAETEFRALASRDLGPGAALCRLGHGLALREQGRWDEALAAIGEALEQARQPAETARIRYEAGRTEICRGRFDRARQWFAPLVKLDDNRLPEPLQKARLYVNLAQLWDAYSLVLEADALVAAARRDPSRAALQAADAARLHEAGMLRMSRLAARGGPWPGLVQQYIGDRVDLAAPLEKQTVVELLYGARRLVQSGDDAGALRRLQAAAGRRDATPDLRGDIQAELGALELRRGDARRAAESFEQLARENTSHPRAQRAAADACRLWATLAQKSGAADDYRRVAACCERLLEVWPSDALAEEARWWRPNALQAAGDFSAAAAAFAQVPGQSAHRAEALVRRAVCLRRALDVQRAAAGPEAYRTQMADLAAEMLAASAEARVAAGIRDAAEGWRDAAAELCVGAAEHLAAAGVERFEDALHALEGFEDRFSGARQIGRVLAVRLAAFRELGQPEKAAEVLTAFLAHGQAMDDVSAALPIAQAVADEGERLVNAGAADPARRLAAGALAHFASVAAVGPASQPADAPQWSAWQIALARVEVLAGRHAAARSRCESLLKSRPGDVQLHWLHARMLSVIARQSRGGKDYEAAQRAWSRILADDSLRRTAPAKYWEARYELLALTLDAGDAAAVVRAIDQERVWSPKLGESPWAERMEALYDMATAKAGGGGRP